MKFNNKLIKSNFDIGDTVYYIDNCTVEKHKIKEVSYIIYSSKKNNSKEDINIDSVDISYRTISNKDISEYFSPYYPSKDEKYKVIFKTYEEADNRIRKKLGINFIDRVEGV